MTIHSRNYPYSMANWLSEKSESACEQLCIMAELLEKIELPEEVRGRLLESLHGALYDVSKIIQYAYDTDLPAWDADAARQMLERGPKGFANYMSKVKEFSDMKVFEPFERA